MFSSILSKVLGGSLVAALAFALWQTLQLSAARDANTLLTAQLATAQAQGQLSSQSIDAYKEQSDQNAAKAATATEIANKAATTHIQRAQTILKEVPVTVPVPTPVPTAECSAALDLLRKYQ